MQGRVLIIAGSDPSGGAGIQADIKTVTALGGYAMTAITAVTVQNTTGVSGIHKVPVDVIKAQATTALEDIGADVIKIGMIGDRETAETIEQILKSYSNIPVVLDPVLVATSGDTLSDTEVAAFIRDRLLSLSALVTPNLPEAVALSGIDIAGSHTRDACGAKLMQHGADAVLLKGGHASGLKVEDILYMQGHQEIFSSPRLQTHNTHGTGCTLASAVATGLAQGKHLPEAVSAAVSYTHKAIETAPDLGQGHGPLNHGHTVK